MSGFSKVIPIGAAGSLTISEAAGVASVVLALSESIGGGSTAGVAKGSVSAQVDVSAVQLIDAGLGLAAIKFPSFAAELALLKAAVDAELAKV